MKKWLPVTCLIVALPVLAVDAAGQKAAEKKAGKARPAVETFTDPAKAGPDYEIQGEYVGEVPNEGKFGVQIVAEGDGKFTMRSLRGGLPGDGWDGQEQYRFTAKTDHGKTTFEGESAKGTITAGTITATLEGGETATLKRVVRHSPTEGAKPPAGAVVLFDGKSADAWDHGKVENGLLSVMVPNGQTSKQKFGDCTLHVEFILPFMPRARGQARGNSGVYLQGRYEVQVLDSFGLEGKNNECGAIYELSAPRVNMCYPPLQWQTYDIDYTAARYQGGRKASDARITVRHNGVLVQDGVELKHDTRAAVEKEGPAKGPIHLQNHGNPVYYRNIWVVEKSK
jgi:hypothetical protein